MSHVCPHCHDASCDTDCGERALIYREYRRAQLAEFAEYAEFDNYPQCPVCHDVIAEDGSCFCDMED